MRTLMLGVVVALCACGSGSEQSSGPAPYPDTRSTDARPSSGRMKIRVTTIGDAANALGLHSDFLVLGDNACRRMRECGRELGDLEMACHAVLAIEWCKTNDCSEGFLTPSGDDPCIDETRGRACDDVARPLQCEPLKQHGLTLYMHLWPEGEVKDPYESL